MPINIKTNKFIFLLLLYVSLFFPTKALASTPTPLSTPTNPSIEKEINGINSKIEKLRKENYEIILQNAEDTVKKSNQLVNIVGLVATLFGGAFTFFAIFFGLNFELTRKEFSKQLDDSKDKLNEMKKWVKVTREQAEKVKGIVKSAAQEKEKVEQYTEKINEIVLAFEKLPKSPKSKADLKEIITDLISVVKKQQKSLEKLQSLYSQATTLSGTASLASGYNQPGTVNFQGFSLNDEYGIIDDYLTDEEIGQSIYEPSEVKNNKSHRVDINGKVKSENKKEKNE